MNERKKNKFENSSPKEVKFNCSITRIGDIENLHERFSCEAILYISWKEDINILQKLKRDDIENNNFDVKSFWDPQLYFQSR